MKIASLWLICALIVIGQVPASTRIQAVKCVQFTEAYGGHVRFTAEEHIQILLDQKASWELYSRWESASRMLDWFSGKTPVPLAEIKKHMPRAVLFDSQFPVDQKPPVGLVGYKALIDAETAYYKAQNLPDWQVFMKKYGIGPQATLDEDMGGATAVSACEKYEEIKPKETK